MKNPTNKMAVSRRLFAIIALAVVIAFSMAGCDDGNTSSSPLDGVWSSSGEEITIRGSSGTFSYLNPSSGTLKYSALNQGYIYVGKERLRNLVQTADSRWSGEALVFNYNTNSPSYCTGVSYISGTITMSSNRQTMTVSTSSGTVTYTRVR